MVFGVMLALVTWELLIRVLTYNVFYMLFKFNKLIYFIYRENQMDEILSEAWEVYREHQNFKQQYNANAEQQLTLLGE